MELISILFQPNSTMIFASPPRQSHKKKIYIYYGFDVMHQCMRILSAYLYYIQTKVAQIKNARIIKSIYFIGSIEFIGFYVQQRTRRL